MKKVLLRTISLITFAAVLLSTVGIDAKPAAFPPSFFNKTTLPKATSDATFRIKAQKPFIRKAENKQPVFTSGHHKVTYVYSGNDVVKTETIDGNANSTETNPVGVYTLTIPGNATNIMITAVGASGGKFNNTSGIYASGYVLGGLGASFKGSYGTSLQSQSLSIVVGQKGAEGNYDAGNNGSGGGGGSFVYKTGVSGDPLIAAGGGGGAGSLPVDFFLEELTEHNINASHGVNGNYGLQTEYSDGGTLGKNGNGGGNSPGYDGATPSWDYPAAGGGAGWLPTNTDNVNFPGLSGLYHGSSPQDASGAIGGNTGNNGAGGYGGAGAANFSGGGGGGGYSGGGGGAWAAYLGTFDGTHGGGGGSFFDASAGTKLSTDSDFGTQDSDGTVVVEWDEPSACTTPTITGPVSVCANNSITLTGSGTPASSNAWTSSNPSVATVNNTGVVTGMVAGTAIITYTNDGGCSQTTTITVNANITPTFDQVAAICSGSTLSALPTTSTNNITGTWSPALNNTATTTYTFTPDAGQCATTTTMTITVNALPAITASGNSPVCAGGTVHLTAGGGVSYIWDGPNGFSSTVQNPSFSDNSLAGTLTYHVKGTDANGCLKDASVDVTILPAPTITGSTSVCVGGTSTLTGDGTPAVSNAWTTSNASVATVSNTGVVTGIGVGSATITYTNNNGCSQTVTVQVNAVPTVLINTSGSTSFCEGGSVTLTANTEPGLSYLWSTGETTASIIVSAEGTYTLTATNAGGCSGTASVNVVVNTYPAKPTITGPSSACVGQTITLTANGASNYLWNNPGSNNQSITVSYDPMSVGTVTYTVSTSQNNCVSVSDPFTVTVSPTPTISGSTDLCVNGTTTLTGSGTPASVGAWVSSNPAVATVDNAGVVSGVSAGNATITYTNSNGCSQSIGVLVHGLPTVLINSNGPTTFCAGGSVVLTANTEPGLTYKWSPNGETSNSITVSTAGVYTLTATSNIGCSGTASQTVTVNAYPAKPTITGPSSACVGQTITLTANGASNYLWNNPGSSNQSITVSYDPMSVGTVNYTVSTSQNNCVSVSDPFTVTVNDLPTITGATVVCAGGTITLTGNGTPASNNAWVSSNTDIATVNNAGVVSGVSAGNAIITYTNNSGCSQTINIQVNGLPAVLINSNGPTTFCAGGSVTLTANTESGLSYQWSTGETTQSVAVSASGDYTVTVTENGCSATSAVTTVTAVSPPDAGIRFDEPTTVCPGNTVTLHATAENGNTYQWTKDGIVIDGATGIDYIVTATGQYRVTVTNSNGCAVTTGYAIMITVEDVMAPVTPSLPNITGECSATAPVATTTDACAGTIIGTTSDPLTYTTQGDHIIHWTFTDPSGNSTTADQHVIIADVTPPTVACPGNISTTANTVVSGQSGAMVSFSATASDNCGTPTITYSQNPGTFFPVGTTTVTVTADDGHGHTATCTFDVIVTCSVATPTISAGGPRSFCPGGSVTLTSSAATGNVWSTGATTQSITVSATGTYSVTVNDGSCSAVSAGISVTAQDITAPVTPTLADITGECSATAPVATTTDACAGTITGTTSDPLTYNTQGDHVIHWTFTDPSGNSTTADQHVIIKDVTAPVPDLALLPTVQGECSVSVTAPTATDNCSGAIVGTTLAPISYTEQGTYTITWTYDDGNGNVSTQTQTVIVKDITAPVPDVVTLETITGECSVTINATPVKGGGTKQKEPIPPGKGQASSPSSGQTSGTTSASAPTATDNCVGSVIGTTTDPLTYTTQGTYVIHWTYDDGNGNTSTQTQTVIVQDTQAPVVDNNPLPTITGECSATVTEKPTATDNCAGTIIGTTSDPLTYNTQGDHVIHWTFTDPSGNSTTADQHVIITDVTPPTVVCPGNINVTANTVVSGQSGAMVSFSATASDNCGTPTITYSQNPGTFFPVGTTTVTVTADDGHGHTATCTFDVVVNCVTPVFTACPSDISKSTDAGVCGAVVNYVSTASGDPATTYSYAFTGATTGSGNGTGTGSVFNTGVTTVTITASNICGNATCSFTVTVTDKENPVITGTPSTINKTNDAGNCGAVVTWSALSAADNCSVVSFTSDHHSGDVFPVGTTTVTYTATDAAGNTSSSSFDVVVTDNEVPVVTCPSGITVTANTTESSVNGAHVTYGAATATDNCGVQSIVYSMPSGGFFPVGDNVVDVTVTDIHGNVSHCSFHVVVNCVTPVFTTCPSDISKSTDAGVCGAVVNYVSTASGDPATTYSYAFTGATTGSGNGTGTGSVFNTGVTTVTVTASNICGNAVCSFTVTVTDTEKPVITGTPSTINKTNDAGNCGAVVTWSALSAADNCSVVSFTSDHHSGDVFPVGTTTVTYTAKDAAGNTTTTHFDIVVTDNENPVITVPSDVTHTADAGLCSFTFGTGNQTLAAPGGNGSVHGYDGLAFVYATATDNCGVTVTGVRDDGQPLDAAYPVGVTTITWTATDIHGHSVSGNQKITITDDENPVIVGLPGNISQSNDAGQCGAVVNWTAATATDNCPGVAITSDHHSGDLFPIGNTTVTYTATDAHGHTVTGSFIVTVNDTEKPKVKAPGMYGVVSEPGKCGATIANIGQPQVSDNCGIASVTNDHPSGFYPVGTTTVTWIVTDVHGNVTDTAKQLISVIDNEKPTITAPASITVNNDPGTCGATLSIGTAVAADNCGVFSVTNDHPSNYYPVGTTIVTWTVLDIHGFKAKATQTITVIDNEPPVITVPSDVSHTADAGLCSFSFDAGASIQTAPGGNAAIGNTGVSLGVATATDNCAVTVTGVRDDGQPLDAAYPVGVTTITWTATDIHGNAVSGTQKVTITDDEYPVIVGLPGNINKGNDLNTCGAVVNWTAATATDNCPGVTIVSDHHSGDVFPLGTTLVTYTATDAHGHSVTGHFSVTVSDVQKPVVQCPADITVNASTTNNGQPGANVTFAATASDNCGVPVISYSVQPGSFFPVGTTTVTTTVDDGHGNTATCSFNVTVNCVPPVITVSSVPTSNTFTGGVPTSLYLGYGAQSTVLKTTVAGGGNYSYAWSGSGAARLNSTTGSAPLFTPTEAGSYQFTVVATNGVGCQSSGTISICVTDIRVPGNMSSDDDDKVDDHASCDHKSHSAKDCPHKYEKDNKCDHKSHNDKDCPYKKGDGKYGDKDDHDKYDGKNRHDDGKNYASKSGTKEHDDKDDHQVTCDHKAHSAWNCPHRYEKDNKCDHKAHSEKDCPYKDKKDDHHITCDHKAHSAKDCPHKDEKDNKCDHKSHSEKDCPYKDKDDHDDHHEGDGEHGQDNYKVFICHVPPGNPSQHITLSISINAVAAHLANHPGDRLGSCEQAPCSGYTDLEKPVISCPPAITVDCSSSMVPSVTGKATATDNSGVVSVTYTDTDNQGSDANAANFYNYTITRTWKATDPAGNTSECSQLITVRDQVKPVINCPGNVTLTCAGDLGTATAGTATATDNSNGPVTITYSDKNGGEGIYRTWTATDASGNYATCTQKITVRDDVKPVITVPADVTAQCGTSFNPSVTGTATATDNCSAVSITYSDYTRYNVITRTWKATDASGNYSTDVQKITIVDNVKPVITAPADKSISCGASTDPKYCGGTATGTDGCSDVTISYSDVISGNVIVRTWKATDASGNYSTAVQNITIIDNVKPVITDPRDITISCGSSTAPTACGSATATDNCSSVTVTYSDVTNDNVITRTWKATDAAGNYSTSTQKITIVDNTKPVITDVPDITVSCNGSTAPSATGTATATDACSDVTVTYSDVVSGNKITRTWKATDAAGNYSTSVQTITQGAAFDVDITSVPTSSTYTGGVSTNLYLGYGAQSTTLQTNSLPSGGAPYTYNWSGSYVNKLSNSHSAAPVFTPATFGYYTFSVQVTNKYGCTSTESISICVTDIRVPGCNGAKVYVCHTTSGKYGKQQTLEVPLNQVSSHIGSGYNGCGGSGNDRLGSCDQSPCNITSANSIVSNSSTFTKEGGSETVTTEEDLNVVAMPNPSTTYFTLKVSSRNKEEINMRVLDAGGRVIDAKSKIVPNSTLQIGQNYSSGTYYAELIQGTRRKVVQLIKGRG